MLKNNTFNKITTECIIMTCGKRSRYKRKNKNEKPSCLDFIGKFYNSVWMHQSEREDERKEIIASIEYLQLGGLSWADYSRRF